MDAEGARHILNGLRRQLDAWRRERAELGSGRAAARSRLRQLAGTDELAAHVRALEARLAKLSGDVGDAGRRLNAMHLHEERLARLERKLRIRAVMEWADLVEPEQRPLISVVIPTRERPRRLRRALDSLRAQSYSNWEGLVCDDAGSAEQTAAVIAELGDERIRLITGDPGGACAARNRGLEAARGELVAYLDDDNVMHPNWLKTVAWAFSQRPDEELLYGAVLLDDGRELPDSPARLPGEWFEAFSVEAITDHNVADASAIAHRAELATRWDEKKRTRGDWDFFLRASAARDPLALPAIACLYLTDAPGRLSTRASDVDADERAIRDGAPALIESARPLERMLAAGPPLASDAWSLDLEALRLVLDELDERDSIVECGSGVSTMIIARRLRERGHGHIYSLEHHPEWVRTTRERIAAEGLQAYATVVEAPLEPTALAGFAGDWYALRALAALPQRIELLLVDGPPAPAGEPGERARYPALPLLAGRLAPGCAVILDDANRRGERWAIERWRSELGIELEPCGERLAVGRWGGPNGGREAEILGPEDGIGAICSPEHPIRREDSLI